MINYCEKCKKYTLEKECGKCGGKTIVKKPAKFKLNKDYSKERLKLKGLL